MLRPRRVLSSPLKLVLLVTCLFVVYYFSPGVRSLVEPDRHSESAAPLDRTRPDGDDSRAGAAQGAQLDAAGRQRPVANAKAAQRRPGGRPGRDGEDSGRDGEDAVAAVGAGARGWAAADEMRRKARKEKAEREKGREAAAAAAAGREREARPQPARPAAVQKGARVPFGRQQAPADAPLRNELRPPAQVAPQDRRPPAVAKKPAEGAGPGVDAPGGGAKAEPKKNTYEQELQAIADRRARQDAKMRAWDDRAAAAAAGKAVGEERRKVALDLEGDDEDDDLDGVQRGGAAQRGAAAAGRKKGPLIQVGGARHAAGDDKAARPAAAAAAAKDRQGAGGAIKGWDQRFKRPAPPAAGVEAQDEPPPKKAKPAVRKEDAPVGDPEIAKHRLVRRLADREFSSVNQKRPAATPEDSSGGAEELGQRYNLTVCAFIPHEKRFLGEWLLYHRLLGVERFALYDTSHPGVFGAAEIDELVDIMKGESGEGELAPTIEELKAHVGTANSDLGGLDERGEIRKEKIAGFEHWIDQGAAKVHWMNFGSAREARDPHGAMLEHCVSTFSASSDWLVQLDVDEFLSVAPTADRPDAPDTDDNGEPVSYPLLDLLESPSLSDAACVPLPLLNYRNYGIRELPYAQGVLESQIRRDVIKRDSAARDPTVKHQRIMLRTAFSAEPAATFSGPHSCLVRAEAAAGASIKDSAGAVLQSGGRYKAKRLPTEPLAVAHYVQRDLRDCFAKLSSLADPNDIHPRSRGMLSCEEHYVPTPEDAEILPHNEQNRFLLAAPPSGAVELDRRVADSWAARATREIRRQWQAARDSVPGRGRGRGGDHDVVPSDVVERARRKVRVLDLRKRPARDADQDES
ncbi:hypothetical protein JCM8202v2_003555 [Rhodotorula sphaerocarpa]